MKNIYEPADKVIRELNRRNLKAFGKLKTAKWDELNVIRQVDTVYEDSIRMAKQRYYEMAVEVYIVALYEAGVDKVKATQMADDHITRDWILQWLTEVDPVTLYAFLPEAERKKQRLMEALVWARNRNAEIDKALRYWSKQLGQYAINLTDYARIDAFKAAGISEVIWETENDELVCEYCEPLDGKVFPIIAVPAKKHLNCRCHLVPVLN